MIYKKLLKELSLVNAGSRLTPVFSELEGVECAGLAGEEPQPSPPALLILTSLLRNLISFASN